MLNGLWRRWVGLRGLKGVLEGLRGFLEVLPAGLRRLDPGVEVYLVGSWARGDWLLDSDVDPIVVSDMFDEQDMAKRIVEVRCLAPRDVAFEILAYTRREFEEVKKRSVVIQNASTHWRRQPL